MPQYLIKDPDESIVYSVSFVDSVGVGEEIDDASIGVSPSGLTIGSVNIADNIVQITISGGTHGVIYEIQVLASSDLDNVFSSSFNLAVQNDTYLSELVLMVRLLINDMESTPVYSDDRLLQIIILAAQYVLQEVYGFDTIFSVNVGDLTITPDPTADATRNNDFINFIALKAACILDESTARMNAGRDNMQAVLGPAKLVTGPIFSNYKSIWEGGPCKTYAMLKKQANFGNLTGVRAIISPFVSNLFDPKSMGRYSI